MISFQRHEAGSPPLVLRNRQIALIHLFSGRRRRGDFQELCEVHGAIPTLETLALSVDVVISGTLGNLLRKSTLKLFIAAFHQGVLRGSISGPPCEAVSRARENILVGESGHQIGPRPLVQPGVFLRLPSDFSRAMLGVIQEAFRAAVLSPDLDRGEALEQIPELGKLKGQLRDEKAEHQRMGPDYDRAARQRAEEADDLFHL